MPTVTYTRAAARALQLLDRPRADRALRRQVHGALDRLAADPAHPGLRTHRHHNLSGHAGQRIYGSRVGAGCGWRIHWKHTAEGIEVVRIGPHP